MTAPPDIATWLGQIGLPEYAPIFAEHAIDREVLADLDDQDLRELGVPLGHRKRLLKAIAALREPAKGTTGREEVATAGILPREAERRQLTVLFCDLVGSTALAARLDPEDMGAVIRGYQQCCAEVVERWGGHVAKYMGDGVLAYFGWPQAHEDDAERAVRAALELADAIGSLATPAGGSLAARVGIATGLVMVGELIGAGAAREQTVVGETPNLAARLQAMAEPGCVVIGAATRRLVGGLFELGDLGPQQLKGFAEPLGAWRVEGEGCAEGRFEARQTAGLTPLVGREEEIALLLRRWRQACDGEGQVVLLSGEPGIGKSRLVREVRARLEGEPHIGLLYQCSPHHTTSALHPLIEQLERAAGFTRDDPPGLRLARLETLLARGTDRLDQVVPLIAALLGLPTEDRYASLDLTPLRQKQLTLAVLVDQLAGLAADQPVLLTYEDAHWIDPTTQELLGLTIERIQHMPVLALITFRPEFQPPWSGQPHVSTLALTRLGRRDGAALVERLVRDKPLPDEVAAQIVAKTDGVPLFVEELTKTVLESGLLQDAGDHYELAGPLPPLAIPATLHDSLLARLDRLAPVKEIAQIGAALGREFSHNLLAAVAGRPEPELLSAVDQLVAAELVFRRGTPPEATYSFKHALVQDAAYGTLLKSRQAHLHARIAKVLEEQFPETADSQPEIVAHHCTCAGVVEKAIDCWHKAGQQAIARSAMVEAVGQLTKGLEVLRNLPGGPERDRQELELQVTMGVALLAARGQPAPETGQAYARARELSERLGETRQLLRALSGLASHHGARAELPAAREAATTMLRLARERDDVAARIVAHRAAASTAVIAGQFTAARTAIERVFALDDRIEPRALAFLYGQDPWASARAWLSWPLLATGYPDQALASHREGLARAEALGHPNTLAQALYCGCVVRQQLRDTPGVVELAGALAPLSLEQGFPYWLAMATVFEGWALSESGEADLAITHITRGVSAFRATSAVLWLPYFLSLLAEAHMRVGKLAQVRSLFDDALARVTRTGERWFEAELHRGRGDALLRLPECATAEAEACFRTALAIAQEQEAKLWELRAATSLARLWRDQGKRTESRDLLAPVYGWFTEGFDTADLKDAKALLDELQ